MTPENVFMIIKGAEGSFDEILKLLFSMNINILVLIQI